MKYWLTFITVFIGDKMAKRWEERISDLRNAVYRLDEAIRDKKKYMNYWLKWKLKNNVWIR